ncbi:outer membrane protein [Labrys monachus]|uniref:Outer membrane immunogenic protein n=1 Tax=Labrys monachus TaxID=217067 RepID=A0ABU0FCC5_9HYPH|nr:outer membrane protein [Labrys monachus]MDQ0391784.1 outer membrane immunogenic protein [Labrys monachus]
MKFLPLAAVLLLSSTAAFAADLAPQAAEPIAPIVAPFSWTGLYAGINGGYAFGTRRDANMTEALGGSPENTFKYGSLSQKGGFGGIQAGYNQQYGNFVLGLEADIEGAAIDGKASRFNNHNGSTVSTKDNVNWFGTVRPRIGYAFDNILIYATGGVAFGGVRYGQDYYQRDVLIYTANSRDSSTKVGFVLGAGVEYAINDHWSAKLEYQYIDLGTSKASAPEITGPTVTGYSINGKMRTDFSTIRLGLNYRF